MDRYKLYFQDSCENVAVSTFTPSNNGGKQAFTVTGYTLSDYVDVGDDLAFTFAGNYYVYTIIDITGNQITMSFDYNSGITNVNTTLQFSIKVLCNPYNFTKGRFEWNKDKDNYFYRMKYSGRVLFKGEDYTYLQNALFENCCEVTVKVYKLCDNSYSLYYRSKINKTEGTWNESRCTFETELPPNDKYSCILESGTNSVNIYQRQDERVTYLLHEADEEAGLDQNTPFWEFIIVATPPVSAGTTYDNGDGGNLFIEINSPSGEAVDPVTGNAWTVYCRNRKTFIYEGDINFVATDPLNGYDLLSQEFVDGKWKCVYTKQESAVNTPIIDFYLNAVDCDIQQQAGYKGAVLYDAINDNCISLDFNSAASEPLYQGVGLGTSLEILVSACNNISGVTSDFFEINPIGDTTGYAAGYNYVTGFLNRVSALIISHISDVFNPNFTGGAAQVANISFTNLLKSLNTMFNVYWFIDSSNRVRIEHASWFIDNIVTNLVNTQNNKYKKEYTFISDEIPKKERFKFKYSLLADNTGTDIVYSQICTNKPLIAEKSSEFITDLYYLRNVPKDNFSNDSLVMLASYNYSQIVYELGVLSETYMYNNHLAWANLHETYHYYNRILENGNMNFNDVTFLTFRKLRKQTNQKLIECCLDIPENQANVITELGTGDATKITFDINSNTFEFELNI